MVSIDQRTRFRGDAASLEPASFLAERVESLDETSRVEAGRAARAMGVPPLTITVAADAVTFGVDDERVTVESGSEDRLVVDMDAATFFDVIEGEASTFGAQMTGRATVREGDVDAFIEWEPALRCLLDGRRSYVPGSIDFADRDGGPLDLGRSFRLDDDRDDIGHFLAEAGFLHLEGVFTEAEMGAVAADLDDAVATAEPDDGASWWATTADGESYAARILGFNQSSAVLRELLATERFAMIGTFTDDPMVQRDPEVGDSAEGLLKKVGVVQGISDVSWHKDCSMGGHSRSCCGLVVGISVTGAGPTNGELGVVPGSHRANIPALGRDGLDLAPLALPTATGDVTVHCSCTLHMSRPPVSAERRVVYTGFGLAPRPGDVAEAVAADEARTQRAALNDHVRAGQGEIVGSRRGSFDL